MPAFDIPTLVLIMTSPAVGSFIAVLVDWFARGEDIARAPSRCRSCARRLGPAELVPLVSYILQKGRCRH
jgi:leader peptidase (prepilin peptidase)/N-methyltransferase